MTHPQSTDEYLAALPADQRTALQDLRAAIRAAAPEAEECVSYDLPSFRQKGVVLVSFGAAKHHCSLYAGAHPIRAHGEELADYDTSKGTIRFQPDRPLPPELVAKLVRTRIAERVRG